MITAKSLNKYSKYSTPELRSRAGIVFRKWIKKRDEGQRCISCGAPHPYHAGHYYSAGHYPELEFNENNVHLQCVKCNCHLHGNLIEYRKGLIKKIGQSEVSKLDLTVELNKRTVWKHSREYLIEIIQNYK